ncbi:MAG: YhcN/YlaJ family sporulation lipoprotein [Thermoanaerobacteraceae bacterium]|nr:YhcN/YlaJ family sporulation lipoprotein [Thermoanaerobacteraceae bacterium]
MRKNRFIYIMVFLLICSLIVVGCQATRRPTPPRTTPRTTRYTPPGTPPATPTPTVPSPGAPNNIPATPSSLSVRASNIANAVSRINGVDRTTVVISGNNALVGIRLSPNYPTKNIDDLKKNVTSTVKATDKGIKNVYVTTDAGLYNRIDRTARDITGGKTLSNYSNEISDIIKRIGK